MKKIIYPKSLKKTDKIAIISPAGAVEKETLQETLDLIQKHGYQPVIYPYALGKFSDGYLYSGTEEERAGDINRALNDDEISAVWATRGGYGCQHLLGHLRLKKFTKNPKWYIGYSDNTVIQSYLLKKGFASIHGQTVKTSGFGITKESYERIFKILKGNITDYQIDTNEFNRAGTAEGTLVGGNLALVYALLGTRYSFDFQDNILFIEEVGENFYALDRMLMSLELAGVFKKIKGLVVGGMTNMGKETDNPCYEAGFDEFACHIVKNRIGKYKFPALFGFPNGHIRNNLPLIIGAKIKLSVKEISEIKFI